MAQTQKIKQTHYPLLPYSQLVHSMLRWMPRVYWFEIRWSFPGGAGEEMKAIEAVRKSISNHPVFSMRVDRKGMHYAHSSSDSLHGQYHDVRIWQEGEKVYCKLRWNRILGDAYSEQVLYNDFIKSYIGEPLEQDDYWGYLEHVEQLEQSTHYADSKAWLEHEFADTSIPVRPTIDRCFITTLLPPKAGLYQTNYTDLLEPIRHLAEKHFLSMDGLFSLSAALAIADYCGTDEAALTWAYIGRERPEEQHIFGSLHKDVPFMVRKSRIQNRESAIKTARTQIRSGIAHSDYPYTLTKPHTARWNYAVNVLRVPSDEEILKHIPFPVEKIPSSPQKYAYALLDIEIHASADRLELWYRYSATHYKAESIRRFAALLRHYAEWLTIDC